MICLLVNVSTVAINAWYSSLGMMTACFFPRTEILIC